MGEILLEVAEQSKDRDSVDCMKLVVFCNAPDDNPFMAGAFHGVTEADAVINLCKMKTHALERVTGAVKNVYGLICGYRKAAGAADSSDR